MKPEMKDMTIRYVLGEASAQERLLIEEQYFSDSDFLDELQETCHDLLDDYVRREMPAALRPRFEQALQLHPWLHQRLFIDEIVIKHLAASRQDQQVSVAVSGRSFSQLWSGVKSFVLFSGRLPLLTVTTAVILLLVVGFWWSRQPERADSQLTRNAPYQTTSPRQEKLPSISEVTVSPSPAEPQSNSTSSDSPAARTPAPRTRPFVAAFLLSADVVRSSGIPPALRIPQQANKVRLQVELADDRFNSYQAVLQTNAGKKIRQWRALPVHVEQGVAILILHLPARLLKEDEYRLKLNTTKSPLVSEYQFSVTRQ